MTVEVLDPQQYAGLGHEKLNRFLEDWYNGPGPELATYVPYHRLVRPADVPISDLVSVVVDPSPTQAGHHPRGQRDRPTADRPSVAARAATGRHVAGTDRPGQPRPHGTIGQVGRSVRLPPIGSPIRWASFGPWAKAASASTEPPRPSRPCGKHRPGPPDRS